MTDDSTTWAVVVDEHRIKLTLNLKMTTAQVVETSATVTNSSFQSYTHLDEHTRQTTDTPGFKPFAMLYHCAFTSCGKPMPHPVDWISWVAHVAPISLARHGSPSGSLKLSVYLFVRLDEDRLRESSPVLARLFLQSIFIAVDIRIREGHLFCDCLCDNGPLYNGQVSGVFYIY